MILIVGASGAVGVPVIEKLKKQNCNLVVLTSNKVSSEKLITLGVDQTIIGDFHSISDVNYAMKEVNSVCYIPPRFKEDEFEIGKLVVDAAKVNQIGHFCFVSAYHPQLSSLGHHLKKLQVEEYLIDSDLMYTVVQPSMFMQNIRVEWENIVAKGIYPRPYSPDSQMNVIDTNDLGEAIANIITNKNLWGATYELCNSTTISHREMAQIISEELGRSVVAVHRDIKDWTIWAKNHKWSAYAIKTYVKMCEHYDKHGYKYGNDVTLSAIIKRPANDYRTFIRSFIQQQKEHNKLDS